MAATASLSVLLQAVTSSFDKKMKKSAGVVAQFRSGINAAASRVALFGTAAATAAATAIAALTKAGLANVDATSKLADRLGIATEQLERFRFAAQIGGSDAGALDKALERMVRSIGEAGQGLTTPLRGLETLGLKLADLEAMSPDQQFLTIADAISKIDDPIQRATASYQIFGRQGQALLNTLMQGRGGLEALGAEADALGLTFDRVSGAQVEAANDAMTRLWSIGKGLANTLAIELAPFIQEVADRLTNFVKESGGLNQIVVPAIEKVAKGLGFVGDIINIIRAGFNLVTAAVQKWWSWIAKGVTKLAELANAVGLLSDETVAFLDGFSEGLAEGASKDWQEAKDLFINEWPSEKMDRFFNDVKRKSQEAAEEMVKTAEQIPVLTEEMLQKLTEEPVKVLESAVAKVADVAKGVVSDVRTGGAGGSVFRFAQSIGGGSRVEKDQLSQLEKIADKTERLIRLQEIQTKPRIVVF